MKDISIECLGASREVGRSGFILDVGDKILLDYGVMLTNEETQYPLPIKTNIDLIALSHAHLDHSGHIPSLYHKSEIPLYLTPPTLDLSRMLWYDTLKIAGYEGIDPSFSKDEIDKATLHAFPTNYNSPLQVTDNTTLEFFNAGHILGASMIKIENSNKSVLYTGDFKIGNTRVNQGADVKSVGEIDVLMVESTYGDRDHPNREESEKEFAESVREVVEGGGTVLLPSFAIGRSQEVINILRDHKVDFPIFFDGMGQRATKIYFDYPDFVLNPEKFRKIMKSANWIRNRSMRKKALQEPAIIVTTAGMLQGGPVFNYLPKVSRDKKSAIFLTGYQVEGTPGRKLMDEGIIELEEENLTQVKCQVRKFDFSAHTGMGHLLWAIKQINPQDVVCIHGDTKTIDVFSGKIKELGFNVHAPFVGDKLNL